MPIDPGRARPADRHRGQLTGLGLAVAVADVDPGRLVERPEDLGVERLAGGDERAQAGKRR